VPPGEALGGELLEHLVEGGAQLVDRRRVLEQRRRATLGHQRHQRHGRDLHRLRDRRRRVDVDLAQQELALELVGQGLQVGRERGALGERVGL
jgi:hypothetical protein